MMATSVMFFGFACILLCVSGQTAPSFIEIGSRFGMDIHFRPPPTRKNPDPEINQENKYWGMTVADLDRDGRYELFPGNHGDGVEVYWSINENDYQFEAPGLYNRDLHGTAAADLDNDGDLDVIITRGGRNGSAPGTGLILETSQGKHVTKLEGDEGEKFGLGEQFIRGRSVAFLDVNGNGFLDLLHVNRRIPNTTGPIHLLYENLGNGKFEEQAPAQGPLGFDLTNAAWFTLVDYDEDGYMDVILMLWTSIELWRGTGTFTFQKVENAFPNGGSRINGAYAFCEIDFDHDGDMDLYLARGRAQTDKVVSDILFEKRDNIYFPIMEERGLPAGGRHQFVTCGDFNNDGHVDLYVSVVTLFSAPRVPDLLLLNRGDGTFVSTPGTELDQNLPPGSDGNNAMNFDYNLDGKLDLMVGPKNASWSFYENTMPMTENSNYLLLRVGFPRASTYFPIVKRNPLNALVKVMCDGVIHMRRVAAPGQSHSQSYYDTLHFGLGSCSNVQEIEVKYPRGVTVVRRGNLGANRIFETGLYFPCFPNKAGRDCDVPIQPCTLSRWEGVTGISYEVTTSPDMPPIYCPMTGRQF
ncbi:hypothetical protein NDN08_007096 [Rhodosorus marinus]|uniref:ASPIC/UnbV domain-containing protein n=1 Tax=Rhodosorus marinus TaxID=101924 RepID=A0AAV8UIT2_9RHOD|nr:hypothetical protein NDN08_007096 [Rhodosorus marinus]